MQTDSAGRRLGVKDCRHCHLPIAFDFMPDSDELGYVHTWPYQVACPGMAGTVAAPAGVTS